MQHTFQNLNVESKKNSKKYKAGDSMDTFSNIVKDWDRKASAIQEDGIEIEVLLTHLIEEYESLSRYKNHLDFLEERAPLAKPWIQMVSDVIRSLRKEGIKAKGLDQMERLFKKLEVKTDQIRKEKQVIDDNRY